MSLARPNLPYRMASTAHCIPEEPSNINHVAVAEISPRSSAPSLSYSSSSEPDTDNNEEPAPPAPRPRRASTVLLSDKTEDVRRLLGNSAGTRLIENCCGGGCCMSMTKRDGSLTFTKIATPDNDAYRALQLKLDALPTEFTGVPDLPPKTVSFLPLSRKTTNGNGSVSPTDSAISFGEDSEAVAATAEQLQAKQDAITTTDFTSTTRRGSIAAAAGNTANTKIDTRIHPPSFVQPHAPWTVFSAKIHSTRELTKPGAAKRTYHFELDVTDYPPESGVDFKVGGAIGVLAPNDAGIVDEILDLLLVPRALRDREIILKTEGGRWPTVWGEEKVRELRTSRREVLTWMSDVQSYPPTKPLVRLLAEFASDENEKKILTYLVSNEGQGAFCDLRTGPGHITVPQLLHAFPSSKPPLDALVGVLTQLMPRFYSLSNDPHEACVWSDGCRRVVEIAVTVHETPDWRGGGRMRTGVGSGFFERQSKEFSKQKAQGKRDGQIDLRIPMFKGLMANPLARQFQSDGPMLLIGAGVGIAPFRGFVQRRLKTANCANKVWVLQGIRDKELDEIYGGEWGGEEGERSRKVVESRGKKGKGVGKEGRGGMGEGRYVQDEVRAQADLGELLSLERESIFFRPFRVIENLLRER